MFLHQLTQAGVKQTFSAESRQEKTVIFNIFICNITWSATTIIQFPLKSPASLHNNDRSVSYKEQKQTTPSLWNNENQVTNNKTFRKGLNYPFKDY